MKKSRKYYKVLTKDLQAPVDRSFFYDEWQTKIFEVEGPLIMCMNGLHLYTSLENVSIGNFGERVFEAEPIGEYISDKNKICCRKVRLIKELKPEDVKDSEWAYNYCRRVKDNPEVRKNIVDSKWAYYYCYEIEDRPEIRRNITDSMWAYYYCHDVEDKPEVFRRITNFYTIYRYFYNVKKYNICKSTIHTIRDFCNIKNCKTCKCIIYTTLNWIINNTIDGISRICYFLKKFLLPV